MLLNPNPKHVAPNKTWCSWPGQPDLGEFFQFIALSKTYPTNPENGISDIPDCNIFLGKHVNILPGHLGESSLVR